MPNIAVKRDWFTAGFARFQPAPYLKRYAMVDHIYNSLLEKMGVNQKKNRGVRH